MTEFDSLARRLEAQFGAGGRIDACRAPGRINLLGEHVDYNGLPVLPMTLDRGVSAVFRAGEGETVRVGNIRDEFAPGAFANRSPIAASESGSWLNYCKAAVEAINQRFGLVEGPGFDLVVGGTLPRAVGLSSSTALVVAVALAYLRILGKNLDTTISRIALAELLAQGERYVGTQGGGMDQAIILLGDADSACKIDFFPLRVERVPVFADHVFVVCNSLVPVRKSGEALRQYNAGPALSRLIRALVEKQAQFAFGAEVEIERLGDLWFGPLCLTDGEVEALFAETFPRPRTTLAEASARLGMSEDEIRRQWLGELPEPADGFPLQARARHQLTEHIRVNQGRDCLLAGDAETFGALMDASHRSCAEDYFVSSPELDRLVKIARDAGSIGSRLTGAGFGGCTVNLVPRAELEEFDARMKREFYDASTSEGADDMTMIPAIPAPAASYRDL